MLVKTRDTWNSQRLESTTNTKNPSCNKTWVKVHLTGYRFKTGVLMSQSKGQQKNQEHIPLMIEQVAGKWWWWREMDHWGTRQCVLDSVVDIVVLENQLPA